MDTAFAKPSVFRKLTKKANLAHVRYNYDLSPQAEDQEIYVIAAKGAGILVIPPYLDSNQIDEILTKFIAGKDPKDFIGKATKI